MEMSQLITNFSGRETQACLVESKLRGVESSSHRGDQFCRHESRAPVRAQGEWGWKINKNLKTVLTKQLLWTYCCIRSENLPSEVKPAGPTQACLEGDFWWGEWARGSRSLQGHPDHPLISPHGPITPQVSEVSGACLHFQQVPLKGWGSMHLPPRHSRACSLFALKLAPKGSLGPLSTSSGQR